MSRLRTAALGPQCTAVEERARYRRPERPAGALVVKERLWLKRGEVECGAQRDVGIERGSRDANVGGCYLDSSYGEFDDVRFANFGGSRAFQEPAFSPEWTARFGASYGWDLNTVGEIRLSGSARFRSRMALAIDNTLVNSDVEIDGLFQDDYWLYDASLVWTSEDRVLSAGVYARNLSDELYRTDAQEFSNIGNTRTVYYGAPQTVRFVVSARY